MDEKMQYTAIKKLGTPLYVFDIDRLFERCKEVKNSFGDDVELCFSIKANPFLIKHIPDCISKLEVCSPGELSICENLQFNMSRIIFSGVNKTKADVERAMTDNVGTFTAESILHLNLIEECAEKHGIVKDVLLRLSAGSQFGMDEKQIEYIIKNISDYSNINIVGLHYFSGTQKRRAEIIEKELKHIDEFCEKLKSSYNFNVIKLEYGTGLGVDYFGDNPDNTESELLSQITPFIKSSARKYKLTVEMGRFFAAPCGTYLTKVVDTKCNFDINYAICDGGINQLKYDGQILGMQIPKLVHHKFNSSTDNTEKLWTLCGSLCTTSDILAKKVPLTSLEKDDVIAFCRTGAYSVSEGMAAFLSREMPRVAVYSSNSGLALARDFIYTDILNTSKENEQKGK